MQLTVTHFGYSPLKGARHQTRNQTHLTSQGITYNRRWALINPTQNTVLRTVAHPQLMAVTTELDTTELNTSPQGTQLTLTVPGQGSYSVPTLDQQATQEFTSWGAAKQLAPYEHPVNEALSTYLGTPVALAYAPTQNLIYSGALSLIGTATLADIEARAQAAGQPFASTQAARFRCNLIVETSQPYIEESWQGATITLQAGYGVPVELDGLSVQVGKRIGRCAVIDAHPDTGQRDAKLLTLLASYRPRNKRGEPIAGVYARPVTLSS